MIKLNKKDLEDRVSPQQQNYNLAIALKNALINSSHKWQYCFLERGGDSHEIYLSAKQLLQRSERLAIQLVKDRPQNSAFILSMDHGPDFLICFLACIFANKTVIPAPIPGFVSHSMRFTEIVKLCTNTVIITQEHHFEPINKILQTEGLNFKDGTISIDQLWADIDNDICDDLPRSLSHPHKPQVIQFTSGSTSKPKGVMISSENILANQRQVSTRWNFQQEKTALTWLPYFHDMGLFGGLIYPLLSGLKVVQMDPLHFIRKPQRWLYGMSKFRAEFSGGPAFAYGLCNELDLNSSTTEIDLSNWEVAFCGADYVPSLTIKQFTSKYLPFGLNPSALTPVYGLAEATLFVAGQPNHNLTSPLVYEDNLTMGCYLGESDQPNIFISAINDNAIVGENEIGEVCLIDASITQGYYHSETVPGQLLKSGDIGFIKDNYLFICGRMKDIIINHGQNISPAAIEHTAAELSTQLNPNAAAAFQINHPEEKMVLLIEVNKHARRGISNIKQLHFDIVALVQQRVGISLAEVRFLKRGELMRTSSGKVKRQLVAQRFRLGHIFKEEENIDP